MSENHEKFNVILKSWKSHSSCKKLNVITLQNDISTLSLSLL